MLNSDICMSALSNGNNSYNKRLKALEAAIAGYSTSFSSQEINSNDGNFVDAKITDTATINQENVEISNIQDLNVNHIDNRGGFAYLGSTVVESLTVGGDVKAEYDDLEAENFKANTAEIEDLTATKATVKNLTVENKMDSLNVAKLYIDSNLALSQASLTLKIAEAFHNADFKCALRPTWMSKPLALKEELSTVFTLQGIVNDNTELPESPTLGDVYFVRSYTSGSITGPAIATYIDGNWEYILYPGLEDYVTQDTLSSVQAALQGEIDTNTDDISTINTSLGDLTTQFEELLEDLNSGEWATFKSDTETFINETYPAKIAEIEEALAKKIEDPTEEGQYLREVDAEGNASWTALEDNDAFVNKTYEAEGTTVTTITNDENGVVIDTSLSVKVPTADNTNSDKTLDVINQEYLRSNLALSKEAGDAELVMQYKEPENVGTEIDFLRLYAQYGTENVFSSMKQNTSVWNIATKNYRYYRFFNESGDAANTVFWQFALDSSGKLKDITNVSTQRLAAVTAAYAAQSEWMAFNSEAWTDDNKDVAYYAIPVQSSVGGFIDMFKDGKWYGRVKDAEDNEYGTYTLSAIMEPRYYMVGGKSLRNNETSRVLVVNSSTVAADQLKAFLIGVDSNGEEALDKGKSIVLPSSITWGNNGLAAGKNYWWFQNGRSNIFSRVDKDGNIASYTLVDPIDGTALSGTALRNAPNNFIELSSGDIIFYVANCVSGTAYDYFIYCSDDPTASSPVTVFRSGIMWSHDTASANRWPNCANYPFVECGNYVYFFPTHGFDVATNTSTMGSGSTAHWLEQANQYGRFDLTSNTWSYQTLPWTIGNYAIYGPAQHVLTEDGYLWVFPNQVSDATKDGSQCLLISPAGLASTVDLGFGTSVNLWYTSSAAGFYTNGWTGYLNYSDAAQWGYMRRPLSLTAVNSKGLGCTVSPDLNYILLFKGNGEYKLYDYSSGESGFKPAGMAAYRNGPVLLPCKEGFLLCYQTSYAYSITEAPMTIDSGFIYISADDDVNTEPTFKNLRSKTNCYINDYYDGFGYNTTYENYEKRFETMHDAFVGTDNTRVQYGLDIFVEKPETSEGTIYLKDGDYEISSVEA